MKEKDKKEEFLNKLLKIAKMMAIKSKDSNINDKIKKRANY